MALPLSPPSPQQLGRGGVRREMDGGHLLAKFSELLGAKYSSPVFSPPHGEQILNLNQLRRDDPCHSDAGLLGVANREISPGVCPLAEPVRAWVRGLGQGPGLPKAGRWDSPERRGLLHPPRAWPRTLLGAPPRKAALACSGLRQVPGAWGAQGCPG